MKLREITDEINKHLDAYDVIDNQEGLDAVAAHLDSLEIAFKDKAINVGYYILNSESDQAELEKEIERLQIKKKRLETNSEFLRRYLKKNMIETSNEKIETPLLKLSFRKSERVEIFDESKVPTKYWQEKIVKTIMKKEIKEDWKLGIGVDGTVIIEEKHLQIK